MEKSTMLKDLLYVSEHLSCKKYMVDTRHGFHYEEYSTVVHEKDKVLERNVIMFIIKGRCSFSYDQYLTKEFFAGDMLFIPKSAVLDGEIHKGTKVLYLVFDAPLNPCDKQTFEHLSEQCKAITYDFAPLRVNDPLANFINSLVYYLRNGGNCSHLHEIKHKELFLILRWFYTKDQFAKFFYPIIGRSFDFKNFVLDNHDKCATLEELVARSNMCTNAFMTKFKKEFGTSPYQWMLKQKCNKILHKASQGGTTIQEIMEVIGVDSPSHFNRLCKRFFNKTPKEVLDFYQSDAYKV